MSSRDQVTTTATQARSTSARIIGLDVARGLAVFGMFAAHTVPGTWLYTLASGRAAALFAVLAGVSIALLSGGTDPFEGPRLKRARLRIAIRAVLLFALGLALTSLHVPAMVILAFYGVLFLISTALLRLRATTLMVFATVLAIVGPVLSFFLRKGIQTNLIGYHPDFSAFSSAEGMWTLLHGLLLTGAYPVLTWLPFLLAGMAVGRLDLHAVRGQLVRIGAALAVLGYGASWLAMNAFGALAHLKSTLPPGVPPEVLDVVLESNYGAVPTTDPVWLLTAGAHSGTSFEIIGATGVALAVIGICVWADRLRVLLTPLSSVGALALTAYVGHLLALKAIGPEQLASMAAQHPYLPWLALVAGTAVFAIVWRRLLGRGPLEWLLHKASTWPAQRVATQGLSSSRGAR
ncbi:DUF418 domain-containing protein [Allokutzneria oryzae]|uniref:DUF418 domain-containing protein n=1 Tax=Allokutzneria oryzae TaxID=1378989 RepID=A0ABV5ZSY3_9PSEU